jgi:abortive infection bacteriophage resistance protein
MRWETVTSASNNEVYHLYKDDKKILTLALNPFSNSARVECEKQTVLRNEYGIKIGELGNENKESFIDVNDERFYYTIQNNPQPELVLYKESKDKPFVTCSLSKKEGNSGIQFKKDKNLSETTHPGLLMALCWYMFLPVARENVVEFAS